jgi:hypothetical protein
MRTGKRAHASLTPLLSPPLPAGQHRQPTPTAFLDGIAVPPRPAHRGSSKGLRTATSTVNLASTLSSCASALHSPPRARLRIRTDCD